MEWLLWLLVFGWLLYLTHRQGGLQNGLEVLARLIDSARR